MYSTFPYTSPSHNLNPFLADLLRLFPSFLLSFSFWCCFFACTSCVLCFGLHANCSQKSCLLCAHQTFSVGKRLSIQIECNTFWQNCMRVGLSAKSLDFQRLKLAFRAPVDWGSEGATRKGSTCLCQVRKSKRNQCLWVYKVFSSGYEILYVRAYVRIMYRNIVIIVMAQGAVLLSQSI